MRGFASAMATSAPAPHGGGDAHGTGAYDGDPAPLQQVGLPLELHGEQVGVGDLLLDLVPADGDVLDVQDATAVAKLLPVAHPRGDGREGIVVEKELARFVQPVFPVKGHAFGDGRMDGASLQGALGLLAEEAAQGFVVLHYSVL